jgi:hypothetical protein
MTNTQAKNLVIKDIRPGYPAQIIIIDGYRPYYAGSRISDLLRDDSNIRNKHQYTIIQYGANVGNIALSDNDYKTIYELLNPVEFTRVASDSNGNPRFVCHFLSFIGEKDKDIELGQKYELALARSRQLGGRKFHNKQYGGGIVFQMYDGQQDEMSQKIRAIANQ